ncbi:hypothetical protein [Paenibacillus apiarius]|uniref:hypothetical protein n=1 Tax=Paenibacillus apiarius TaxID=46240 RepID=UPI0019814C36|nr:hypothetical protein [Paenibacillus apiarius]MBN3527306.1 hypothetical protein [Paenibacillus apiarius]
MHDTFFVYNWHELTGEEDDSTVEGAFEDYLLVRPDEKNTLMLYNKKTKETTTLYKELLNEEEQNIIDNAAIKDADYQGDKLTFVKKEGEMLYFKHVELMARRKAN